MTLRHIKPRSVDWCDALLDEGVESWGRMDPEEVLHLRKIVAMETATLGMPPPSVLARTGALPAPSRLPLR